MMEKAGYLQQAGYRAFDSSGKSFDIVELHILSVRYAIRRSDLVKAISARVYVQVEDLMHDWDYFLGATRGLARVSASGKALNIDIFNTGMFTISLRSLGNLIYGGERYVCIVKIPETPLQKKERRVPLNQTRISATA